MSKMSQYISANTVKKILFNIFIEDTLISYEERLTYLRLCTVLFIVSTITE